MNKEEVNIKNTPTYKKMNDDGSSSSWRKRFVSIFGGEFIKEARKWMWKDKEKKEKRVIIATKSNGEETEIVNLSKYCKENNLDDGAVYRVLTGERKHHKYIKFRIKGE